MKKINTKKINTMIIWIAAFGGIIAVLGTALYRINSGKISKERAEKATEEREDINENIDKSSSIIIDKLDDVGEKVNVIYKSDESNIENISFPDNGTFGKNILDEKLIKIQNGTYSMTAILPKEEVVKVKISGSSWSYPTSQPIGGWNPSDLNEKDTSRIFTTIKFGKVDFKFYLAKGRTEVKLYVGNNDVPKWAKTIEVD